MLVTSFLIVCSSSVASHSCTFCSLFSNPPRSFYSYHFLFRPFREGIVSFYDTNLIHFSEPINAFQYFRKARAVSGWPPLLKSRWLSGGRRPTIPFSTPSPGYPSLLLSPGNSLLSMQSLLPIFLQRQTSTSLV